MKCLSAAFLFGLALMCAASAMATPIVDSSLVMWLNADDITGLSDGAPVSTWLDSGSAGNNATQAAPGAQPTYVADYLGGVPGVRFDAVDDGMATTAAIGGGDYTIFTLFNYEGTSALRRAINGGPDQGTNNWLIGPYSNRVQHYAGGWVTPGGAAGGLTVSQNQFYTISALRDDGGALPGKSRFIVDGTDRTNNDTPGGYPGTINLGASGAFPEPFGGVMTDVLVYDRLLNPVETAQVTDYLNAKRDSLNGVPPSSAILTENFSSGTIGDHFAQGPVHGGPVDALDFSGANAAWPLGQNYRTYLGTVDTDYNTIDFTYEATVTQRGDGGGWDIAFFGMGGTNVQPAFFGEPTPPNVELYVWPNSVVNGYIDRTSSSVPLFSQPLSGPAPGTHRFRMSWDSANMIAYYEIDAGNDGKVDLAFDIDASASAIDSSNSQLYFGGGNGAVWDDVVVKEFAPGAVPMHVLPELPNLALGDTVVYQSSVHPVSGNQPQAQNVTDGSTGDVFASNYWLEADIHTEPNGDEAYFILDLGQAEDIGTLAFRNTHNATHNDRGTLDFRVEASNTYNGSNDLVGATTILEGTLSNVAGQSPITPDVFDGSNGLSGGSYRYLKFVAETAINGAAGLNEMMVYTGTGVDFYSDDVPPALGSGKSFLFNGVDDTIVIDDEDDPTAYTLSAWVKPAVIQGQSIIVRTAGDPTAEFSHQLRMTSSGTFQAVTSDGAIKAVTGTTTALADQWYHVAAVAENGGMMRLYVDGVEEGTAVPIGTLSTGGNEWRLGSGSGDGTGSGPIIFFNGQIDDPAIWHEVLPAGDVALLGSGTSPVDITEDVVDVPADATLDRYYPLDTDAGDDSGNGVHGTASGATFSTEFPPVLGGGGSAQFDGVDDRVIISDAIHPTAYTISAWVKPDMLRGQSIVVRTADDPTTTWSHQIRMAADGTFEAYTYAEGAFSVKGTTVAVPGQWYHVLATAESGGEMKLYVDGVAEGAAAPVGTLWTLGTQWQIGSDSGNGLVFFDGAIDDVAIFSEPLSQSQINALASGVTPQAISRFSGIIGTNVQEEMEDTNASAWIRTEFGVAPGQAFDQLTLRMRYDDGFVAYLNGTKVVDRNAPPAPAWNSAATAEHPDNDALTPEAIDLTSFLGLLDTGTNVLAIHGLNETAGDTDFLILPELTAHLAPVVPNDTALAINEIASAQDAEFWVELSNTGNTSIELNGLVLTSTEGPGGEYTFGPQQILPGEFLVLNEAALGFGGDDEDRLFLYAPGKTSVIDAVRVKNRLRGRTESGTLQTPSIATPGEPNQFDFRTDVVINEIMYHHRPDHGTPGTPDEYDITTLVPYGQAWRYNASGDRLDPGWEDEPHAGGNWQTASAAPIGSEAGVLPVAIATPLPSPQANAPFDETTNPFTWTYYFETEFEFDGDLNTTELQLRHLIDDGAVFYLNGQEISRFNLPTDETIVATTPGTSVGNAVWSAPAAIPTNALIVGTNRLSAEVHQQGDNSSDVVFAAEVLVVGTITPGIPGEPFAESDEEWIELFNRSTTETIDLGGTIEQSGWSLDDAVQFDFPLGTTIGPGEYLVVAADPAALEARYPGVFAPGQVLGPFSRSLSNSSDLIVLEDNHRNIADEVRYYDGSRWPEAADGGGSSLELRNPTADNSRAEAWAASDEAGELDRSSWQHYSYTKTVTPPVYDSSPIVYHDFLLGLLAAGEVLIDNVTVTDVTGGGSTQLLQNTDFEGDTPGGPAATWRIQGTHEDSRVVVDPDDSANRVLHLIAESSMNYLSNHAETTLAGGATVVDGHTYEIAFDAKWISGSPQLHTELYYKDAAQTTIITQPIVSGTPGRQNSTFEQNIGPTYDAFGHAPAIPSSADTVTVTVAAADPNAVASMTLHYAVGDSASFAAVPMTADAGIYTATIPPQGNGTVVRFYVAGQDGQGTISTYPAAGPNSRALYKVVDGYVADPLRSDLRIIMTPGEAAALHVATDIVDNDRTGSTVVYNGSEVFYDVGTRLKGSMFTRSAADRTGYNIKFDPDHLFRGVHETIGLDQNLEQEIQVKHLINEAGILGGSYDDVTLLATPTGTGGGPTLLVMSRHTDLFLDEQFDNADDGTLYRFEGIRILQQNTAPEALKTYMPITFNWGLDVQDYGDDKEQYRWPFLIKSNRGRDDYGRFIDMAQMFSLNGTAMQEAADAVIDVDQWMQTFAMMSLTGIGDVYSHGAPHNLDFYVRPEDNRIVVLPWDWDFTFNRPVNAALHGDKNIGKLIDLPANERLFYGHMLHMVDTVFNAAYMADWAAHFGSLLGLGFANTPSYIAQRGSHVTGAINADFPAVGFSVTTASPLVVADTAAVVEGTGWVDVREIRLAGSDEPLEVAWMTDAGPNADTWQATVPVPLGEHTYTFEAYDYAGNLIGSQTINIESTMSDRPLEDFLRISELHYNPAPADTGAGEMNVDKDRFEFIELVNTSTAQMLDLSGVQVSDGITFTFADATTLPAGERIVVVRDLAAFESRYDTASMNVAGEFANGGLNNDGEAVALADSVGNVLINFTYNDNDAWPPGADGLGRSLEVVGFEADLSDPGSWHDSREMGGTPGTAAGPTVHRRLTYYAGSTMAGGDAIATDKTALLPGRIATFANYTSFDAGINGIIVDLAHATQPAALGAADFEFFVGRIDTPDVWTAAPTPDSITLLAGGGAGGSDRVVFTWLDGTIVDIWLQVTVKPTVNTGLDVADVFYYGNAPGDTGNDASSALVNAADVIAIRDNPRGLANPASINNPHDLNRDGLVNATDLILARNNPTGPLSALRLIELAQPAAPTPMGEGESTLATGTLDRATAPSVSSLDGLMAMQADQPVVDTMPPSATLSKLLHRRGSAVK